MNKYFAHMALLAKTARKTRPNGRTPNAATFYASLKVLKVATACYKAAK